MSDFTRVKFGVGSKRNAHVTLVPYDLNLAAAGLGIRRSPVTAVPLSASD